MKKGRGGWIRIFFLHFEFHASVCSGDQKYCRYPFRSTWRLSSLFRLVSSRSNSSSIFCYNICISFFLSLSLSLSYPSSVKSNVMWRPRGLDQPTNMSLVTSHGISEHNRARYRGDTFPLSFPLRHRRPLTLLPASLSHARENAFLLPPAEKRVSLSSEVSKGLEGGTIIYLLSLARPRTRVNHPRLRGYCFRRVRGAKIRTRVRPALRSTRRREIIIPVFMSRPHSQFEEKDPYNF